LIVLDVRDGKPRDRQQEALQDEAPWRKISRLRDLVANSGVRLIPFVAGDVENVIYAFFTGGFLDPSFMMPSYFGTGRC
jgi:hypothetical protein